MGTTFFYSVEENGKLKGSSFAEPDGTEHLVELFEGNGKMLLKVQLEGQDQAIDLVFDKKQALAFAEVAEAIVSSLGIR